MTRRVLFVALAAVAWTAWRAARALPYLAGLDSPTGAERSWWVRLDATAAQQITNQHKENQS